MHCVRKVFLDVAEAIKNNDPYDPHSGPRDRGRNVAIKKDSREAAVVFIWHEVWHRDHGDYRLGKRVPRFG